MLLSVALITASIWPLNLWKALFTVSLERMAKEAWMSPIGCSLVLQLVMLASIATAHHMKTSIGLRSGKFGGQTSGGGEATEVVPKQLWIFWRSGREQNPTSRLMDYPSVSSLSSETTQPPGPWGRPLCWLAGVVVHHLLHLHGDVPVPDGVRLAGVFLPLSNSIIFKVGADQVLPNRLQKMTHQLCNLVVMTCGDQHQYCMPFPNLRKC